MLRTGFLVHERRGAPGIPSEMVCDGPHGLRKQDDASDHLGINNSIKAVCFPAGCATASSFNRDLVRKLGETLGEECQAEHVSTILGSAMNIKRSPLCGRNFEYYSEDPYVSTEMAGVLVHGVQSKHVGTSPKRFMANNQEYHKAQQYWIMRSLLSPPFFPLYSKSSSSFRYSLYIKKQLD